MLLLGHGPRAATRVVFVAALCLAPAAVPAAAQDRPELTPAQLLGPPDSLLMIGLSLQETDAGTSVGAIVASVAEACRLPQLFEVPVQIDETRFLLKRAVRVSREQLPEGACREGVLMLFNPHEYHTLAEAKAIVLHLMPSPATFSPAAITMTRALAPRVSRVARPADGELSEGVSRLLQIAVTSRPREARGAAEGILPLSARLNPQDAMTFFGVLGAARRDDDELESAARAYEVATMIAAAMTDRSEPVGVLFDNLATIKRLQKEWDAATKASDQAIAVFEASAGRTSARFGYALNNRALILADQGNVASALEYSDRSVGILKEALKHDPRALQPFLRDNEVLRSKLPR